MAKRISLTLIFLLMAWWGLQQFDFYSAPAANAAENQFYNSTHVTPEPEIKINSDLSSNRGANLSSPKESTSQINLDPKKAFCDLKNQVDIPLGGELRVSTFPLEDGGRKAFVYSSECPREHYSIVKFSPEGKASVTSDCRTNSTTQLALQGSAQASVTEIPATEGELNLALSGPGLFLTWCDEGFRAVRSGKFRVTDDGMLTTEEGCFVWSRPSEEGSTGEPLFLQPGQKEIFFDGCTDNNRCLAILDPDKIASQDPELIGAQEFALKKFSVDGLFQQLNKTEFTYVFDNALEDLNNPDLSITGAERIDFWEAIPEGFECGKE